jgi:uncharacterized protein
MNFDITRWRKTIFGGFIILFIAACYFITTLRFSFDFEQYFPQGDPDLIFFQDFITEGVFEQDFLRRFDTLTQKSIELPYIVDNQSLTTVRLPVKTPFGISAISAIHIEDTSYYADDRAKILADQRFVHNLIDKEATALVLFLKTKQKLTLEESEVLLRGMDSLIRPLNFESFHYLGRANFQKELVAMEKREVAVSTGVAAILVGIIMALLFRRWRTVVIALSSIGLAMILFFGILGAWGRDITAIAALYPVLLVIVGTSDVIHMMSKYIDELRRGHDRKEATWLTIKEIGLATLMTAITTATGFATLVTTRIVPIKEFGINAAVGVMVAYFTVLLFTTSVLSYFKADDLILLSERTPVERGSKAGSGFTLIERLMAWTYDVTKYQTRKIAFIALATLGISVYGVTKIGTNVQVGTIMPNYSKVTDDFRFFEKLFAGFRPLDFAVFAQNGRKATDFEVMREIEKLENHLRAQDAIRYVAAPTLIYKSLNQMVNGNRVEAFKMPIDSAQFAEFQSLATELPKSASSVLVSKDSTEARISTRVLDLGADTVMALGDRIETWIQQNTDSSVAKFRRTGTGYIIDKNATFVRADLLEGIAWEVGLIALMMGLMLRNVKMIVIFLIPNLFPLVFAGALVGFLNVPLDAGIAMIFTVVFGIAIDDTIHFLSSFNINRNKGLTVDEALKTTLHETGKPVVLTTVILFFGFLVMMTSIHPPSVTIGKLIAVTLVTALLSDLFINPLLIRWWIKDKN